VDTLRTLHRLRHHPDAESIAAEAEKLPRGEWAAGYLRVECSGLSVPLSLDKLELRLREDAYRRRAGLVDAKDGDDVGVVVVAPLPPDIFSFFFSTCARLIVVGLDGHGPPPSFLDRNDMRIVRDLYEARGHVRLADRVAFDAYADEGKVWGRRSLADLLDPAVMKPTVRLGVHYRPHRVQDDVLLDAGLIVDAAEL
jgi:hypothetical protein